MSILIFVYDVITEEILQNEQHLETELESP